MSHSVNVETHTHITYNQLFICPLLFVYFNFRFLLVIEWQDSMLSWFNEGHF